MMYHLILLSLLVLAGHAGSVESAKADFLAFDKLLDLGVSFVVGQRSEDNNLSPEENGRFLMEDNTNERLTKLSVQQLLTRSGFQYEDHYVTASDGYITNLVRVINPLADRSQLKQPPVMMLHGGLIDSTVWLWSSAIQHHPERWPRTVDDGPISSWNKSLAFVLANNGYDVWICGTRGSNIFNKGHVRLKRHYNWFDRGDLANNPELNERLRPGEPPVVKVDPNFKMNFPENLAYWNYTMDELVQYEVPGQQEYILKLTGSHKVSLIDLSISTQTDLAIMSENPGFSSRLHNYVSLAPILNNRGTNRVIKFFHKSLCKAFPNPLGTILLQVIMSPVAREFVQEINSIRQLRYTIIKQLTRIISGPSAKFDTNLDGGVVGHILESTGFMHTKQYCQQADAGRLQRFDHGLLENKRIYGSPVPPIYDVSRIDFPNWMLVSGGNDMAATVSSVKQLLASVKRQPTRHVHVKRYNHLDLIAGFENDKFINLPVVDFLDEFAFIAGSRPSSSSSSTLFSQINNKTNLDQIGSSPALQSAAGRVKSLVGSIGGPEQSDVNDNLLDTSGGSSGQIGRGGD